MHYSEKYDGLKQERLQEVTDLLVQIRNGAIDETDRDKGDGPWGTGCVIYERSRNLIQTYAKSRTWLKVLDSSLQFVFSIGGVRIRFHKEPENRPVGTLKPQPAIAGAIQDSFPFYVASQTYLRLVVVTDTAMRAMHVDLVEYNDREEEQVRWSDVGCHQNRQNVVPMKERAKVLGPPPVASLTDNEVVEESRAE